MKKKSKQLIQKAICVKKSSISGFGVFANVNFNKGTVIEECYFIIGKGGDRSLDDYYFDLKGKYVLLYGYGSIYNHSEDPNADYTFNAKRRIATIKAARSIRKGEEILISYGDKWFKSRGMKPKG